MDDRLEIECPCCSTKLVVDRASGDILSEERPKLDADKTFEGAMQNVRGGEKRRSDAFEKAFDQTQRLSDTLEKKFEEAMKKADKTGDEKPRSPFDWD